MTNIPIKLRTGGIFKEEDDLGIAEPVVDHGDPVYHRLGFGSGGVQPRYYPGIDKVGNLRLSYGTTIRTVGFGNQENIFGFEGSNFVIRVDGRTILSVNLQGVQIAGALNTKDSPNGYIQSDSGLAELLFPLFSDKTLIAQFNRPAIAGVDNTGRFRAYRDITNFLIDFNASLTRTQTAFSSYINPNGSYALASANQPRIVYNPISKKCRGLMIEPATTNLLAYSSDLTKWVSNEITFSKEDQFSWSSKGLRPPFSFIENPTNAEHNGTQYFAGNVTKPISGSFFIQPKDFLGVRRFTSYISTNNKAHLFGLNLNLTSAGAIVIDGSQIVGNAVLTTSSIEHVGNNIYRVKFTGTLNSSGTNTQANLLFALGSLGAVAGNTNLIFTGDSTAGNWCLIGDAQAEQANFASSFVPTTYATCFRDSDVFTLNLSHYKFSPSEGTFEFKFTPNKILDINAVVFSLQDSVGTTRVDYYVVSIDRAANKLTIGSKTYAPGQTVVINLSIAVIDLSKSVLTVPYSNLASSLSKLVISGSSGFVGTIQSITYE